MFVIRTIFVIKLLLLSLLSFSFVDLEFFLFLLSFIDNDYVGFVYV